MFYVGFLKKNQKIENLYGTEVQLLVNDLKTVRGVIARYKEKFESLKNFRNVERMEIYRYGNVYDEHSYHLMATIY
jgi:hypothetical protein